MEILNYSVRAEHDKAQFFRAQIIFWLMAATDGHAKNFSISIAPRGRYQLTPLYDVLSAWPVIGHGNNQISWQKCKLAMAVRGDNNYYQIYRIQRRHWIRHGEMSGLSKQQIETMIEEIIARTPDVIECVSRRLPAQFPPQLAESIFDGIGQQCRRLAAK